MEGFRDGSGLFGVVGHPDAGKVALGGMAALQHRGDVGFGVAISDGSKVRSVRGMGMVPMLSEDPIHRLRGTIALGQVFGGLGTPELTGLPLDGGDRMVIGELAEGSFAAAISGRFTNGTRLRRELKERGALFQTDSDAEVLLHLIAQSSQRTPVNRVVDALWKVEGAYGVVLIGPNILIAVRDPRGFRPLVVGHVDGALLVASENTAIRDVGGEVHRDITPGEMLVVDRNTIQSVRPFPPQPSSPCIQELIGLARHDARVFDRSPYEVRVALGERLGSDSPCPDAEVVLALPMDEPFGIGFARTSNATYERGLLAAQAASAVAGEEQWTAVPSVVRGKQIVLVARSLLTGHLLRRAVTKLRSAGALDVHLRIASPPIQKSCIYGVPSPTTDELAWTHRADVAALALWFDANTVAYLHEVALRDVIGGEGWCFGCMDGDRPVVPEEPDDQLPLF